MNKITARKQALIIIAGFAFSRILALLLGLHMSSRPLYMYWQYLDLDTLNNHLLAGIWYDHAQPPVFNLFLGIILKIAGAHSIFLFAGIIKFVSLANGLLIFFILKKLTLKSYVPLIAAFIYLLSPATLIYECELFYTTSVSFLLLVSVYSLIQFSQSGRFWPVFGIFFSLVLLCLMRSLYHIFWLFLIAVSLLFYFRKKEYVRLIILSSLFSLILVGSWYVKNKIIFGKFTTSTWLGMNMARNVFHDNEVVDSSRIEAYEPFSKISVYRKFLDPRYEESYKGLNDRDLLLEMKNDSFINETEVSYIPVSDLYREASLKYIRAHPVAYAKNVIQSAILYFSPATTYSLSVQQSVEIKIYDVVYSFNLTHFARSKESRRIMLTISALPKMILYFLVFLTLFRTLYKK